MLIGWNGETVPALPLAKELEIAGAAGYAGVELFVPKLAPFLDQHSVDDLKRQLQDNGLVPLTLNGIENINLRPPEEFAKVKEECRWLSELARKIDCPCIVVVPSPKPEGKTWPEVTAATISALCELADVAASYGVKLGFEFLAPANCSVRTLAQDWEIIQATKRDNVGLVFDTYHFHVGGSSWASLEEFAVDRLFVVHVNDVDDLPLEQLTDEDRLLPGEGILPLQRMLSRLHDRGYQGAYSLEVMRPAYREREPLEYARAGLEASSKVLTDVGVR
jgi:2-keto-myo-inositol isomerase